MSQPLKPLSIFDFNGTLTYHDSFVPFLRFAFGNRRFVLRLLASLSPHYLYGGMSRDQMKARLIRAFLSGVEQAWLQEQARAYCEARWTRLMRPAALREVARQLAEGRTVSICSASPALVLQPFAERLGVQLIGTELESRDGVLSGEIRGRNCRCEEKVNRLRERFGALAGYHLRAWGDSAGDSQLLAAAQEGYYRPFR